MKKKPAVKNCVVLLDFDNTITRHDVIDTLLERFSKDGEWITLEKMWKNKKIGSRACLEGQIRGLRVGKKELRRHLESIKLDPYFKKLLKLLKSKKIKSVIVTDNFDYFVGRILKCHDIPRIPVFSNKVTHVNDRLIPRFPLENKSCGACGNCKKKDLLSHRSRFEKIIYVGDGLSDVCASRHADMVFAKGNLVRHCLEEGLNHIPIKRLKDVYNYFKST